MIGKSKVWLSFWILLVLVVPALIWMAMFLAGKIPAPGEPAETAFNFSDRIASLEVIEGDDGEMIFQFKDWFGGDEGRMTPAEFAGQIHARKRDLPRVFRWLDVTSWTGLLWVAFGLAGQAVFMGRMLIQWWASEKVKSSVVPPMFWWLSLIGSSMLLIYFVWRKEPVGFIGQCTGWFIYVRNLWFIYGATPAKEK